MVFAVSDVFASYSSALHTSLAHVQGCSSMVLQFYCIKDKWHERRRPCFLVLVSSKSFLYPVTTHKQAYIYSHIFSVSCFSSSDIQQSQYLDGCQAMGKSSSFIAAF